MNPPSCPSRAELASIARGPEVPSLLKKHLETCSVCGEQLEELREALGSPGKLAATKEFPPPGKSLFSSGTEAFEIDSGFSSDSELVPASIGKYRIVARLGQPSGQAEVFRAVHPGLEKEVVIKWGRSSLEEAALGVGLLEEAKLLSQLDHPNLARVYDLDFHEGRPFLVLEYVRGRSLEQVARNEPLSPRRAAALIAKVAISGSRSCAMPGRAAWTQAAPSAAPSPSWRRSKLEARRSG